MRRIFELAAAGLGRKRIVNALNAEVAPAPQAQRGRPVAWCPSSVTEVLHRELYRGRIIWNRTRKRDQSGQHRQSLGADRVDDDRGPPTADRARRPWQMAHAELTRRRAV